MKEHTSVMNVRRIIMNFRMNSGDWIYLIVLLLVLDACLLTTVIVDDYNKDIIDKYEREKNDVFIYGQWYLYSDGEKFIQIRTNNVDVLQIIETARHEICHEIYYRRILEIGEEYSSDDSEKFAEDCNPMDYLEV